MAQNSKFSFYEAGREFYFGVIEQFGIIKIPLLVTTAVISTFLLVLFFLAYRNGIPFGDLSRDPVAILDGKVYIGALSNVGFLLWGATAAITLFSVAVVGSRALGKERFRFLLVAGLFTSWLLFDDMFLFHERLAPVHLGLREKYVLLPYLLFTLMFFLGSWRVIFKTDFLLLMMACGCFFISLVFDRVHVSILFEHLLEDGPKFMGIVFWFLYFSRTCHRFVGELMGSRVAVSVQSTTGSNINSGVGVLGGGAI